MSILVQRRNVSGAALSDALHPVLDRIYRSRGVENVDSITPHAKHLLHFRDLSGITKAVATLSKALEQQQHMVVIGDFDADGATSTALCVLALKAMGANSVDYLVPNRFDFGYGLSSEIVDIAHQNGAQVLITVDSGIACLAGVARAKKHGMQVIITDHHLPAAELPVADAIVNPSLHHCEFLSKHLAGVGVAFYVMSALRSHLQQTGWFEAQGIVVPAMAQWLDLVAVGTVSDVVQLDPNNRILVHQGIQRIRAGQCRPGIMAMLEIAGRTPQYLSASDLGFVIGPRLNAAGRLEDMSLGIDCLLTDDIYLARERAAKLDGLNQQRKQIEQGMREDAERLVAKMIAENSSNVPDALVLHHADFHQGVIGIVAGRIKDSFERPVIAFASEGNDQLKGSARSIAGVHVRDALDTVSKLNPNIIKKFGGHAMAAGLTINSGDLGEFSALFSQVIRDLRADLPTEKVIYTDGELSRSELTVEFAQLLLRAGPFGQGFAPPCFDDVFEIVNQRIVGECHLKLVVRHKNKHKDKLELDAIAFGVDTSIWPNTQISQVRLVYTPDINVFRGVTRLQLMVKHILPADARYNETHHELN